MTGMNRVDRMTRMTEITWLPRMNGMSEILG